MKFWGKKEKITNFDWVDDCRKRGAKCNFCGSSNITILIQFFPAIGGGSTNFVYFDKHQKPQFAKCFGCVDCGKISLDIGDMK